MPSFHDFQARGIDGKDRSLADYEGKVALVVNVASKCGLTPQYAGLEKLYEQKHERGLEVLGFPCNQFAGQEPGSDAEVQEFCTLTYGVAFPLFSKIDVNGPSRHPLYAWLTSVETGPEGAGDIKWNFGKFVIGRDGAVVARFAPPTAPDDPALVAAIDKALGQLPEAQGTPLCRADAIADGTARGFAIGARKLRILVARRGAALHAYVNRCPHVGTPLDWSPDEFMDRDGRHLVCSTHGARFRVDDGVCVAGPCQGDQLEPFPIVLRDGVVFALDEFAEDFA